MTRTIGLIVLLGLAAGTAQLVSAQPPTRRGRDAVDSEAEGARDSVATASTGPAMAALAAAVELEGARRTAPFDLDWGTP